MASELLWFSCDLVTGEIIEELPDVRVSGSLTDVLNSSSTAAVQLPLDDATLRKDWLNATEGGRVLLVAQHPDDFDPIWGGIVIRRRGGSSSHLELSLVTLAGYLDNRFVNDHVFTSEDQCTNIASDLIDDAQIEGINFEINAFSSGIFRDREYKYNDNKTVLRALQELSGVIDGIEFSIDLIWDSPTQLAKIITVANRVGVPALGGRPSAVFTTPEVGTLETAGARTHASYVYEEDRSSNKLANHVVAYSSGEGDSQPFSTPARDEVALAGGWPRWETRFEPSTSIKNVDVLDSHAQRRLSETKLGSTTLAIDARFGSTPRYGRDWKLGDDIGWELKGPRHTAGLVGVGRAIGVELNPDTDTITPILWQPES